MRKLTILFIIIFCNIIDLSAFSGWFREFKNNKDIENLWRSGGHMLFVPKTKFSVENNVLSVRANSSTGLLITSTEGVDLKKTPILRWKWRLIKPVNMTKKYESNEVELDDQALVLYVSEGSMFRQKSLAYRWEYYTPKNFVGDISYAGGASEVKYICLENKDTPLNEWVVESRNLLEDYTNAFGAPPEVGFVISIGANSQHTNSNTHAEVSFIEFVAKDKEKE